MFQSSMADPFNRLETARLSGTLTRLTSIGHNSRPSWSPDGQWIAYVSGRDSLGGVYRVPVDRSESPRMIFGGVRYVGATVSWSPDGRWIVFSDYDRHNTAGVFVSPAAGDSDPRILVGTEANEGEPTFSPNGDWIAFVSDESGSAELYVRRFRGPPGRWTISAGGGVSPTWSASGREVFYEGPDGLYKAVLDLGAEPRVVERTRLFGMDEYADLGWDVHPNGREFVMMREAERPVHLVVVLNWFEELRAKAGR